MTRLKELKRQLLTALNTGDIRMPYTRDYKQVLEADGSVKVYLLSCGYASGGYVSAKIGKDIWVRLGTVRKDSNGAWVDGPEHFSLPF